LELDNFTDFDGLDCPIFDRFQQFLDRHGMHTPNTFANRSPSPPTKGQPSPMKQNFKPQGFRLNRLYIMALVFSLWSHSGCDRTDEVVRSSRDAAGHSHLTSAPLSPKALVAEVKQRYRALTSYEDQGVVRLRYKLNGQNVVDEAPMSVAWDSQGRLGLRVYSTAAGPSNGRWRMRLQERDDSTAYDATQPKFEQQVLSRELPPRVDFEWLLFDPLISQYLAAGMAGFPPQLDLLLNPDSLGGLIDETVTLSFDEPRKIDLQLCHILNVDRPNLNLNYRLWIDQSSGLLRRVEIPRANIPPQLADDQRISQLELSIDIKEPRVNGAIDWGRFDVRVYPDDVLVKQFVAPPADFEEWELGEKFPAFTLRDDTGAESFRGGERSTQAITVLAWLADHPTCQVTAEQLASIEKLFATPEWQGRVNFVSIWAAPQPPAGFSFRQLREHWRLPGIFALDREAIGRDLFNIYEAPTVVVLDPQNRLQARFIRVHPQMQEVLPQLLQELASGVNVAEQALERERFLRQRYLGELAMAVASDGHPRPAPANYTSGLIPVVRGSVLPLSAGPPRAVGTHDQSLWLLSRDGELTVQSLGGTPGRRWITNWRHVEEPAQLIVAPDQNCVALLSDHRRRVRVFHVRGEQASELQLPAGTTVVDWQWLKFATDPQHRLVIIDDTGRTTVFDPANREQLTGTSPSPPLVILAGGAETHADTAAIVLGSGSVEQLEFSEQSLLHAAAGGRNADGRVLPADERRAVERKQRLNFNPAAGPWLTWNGSDSHGPLTLARGWLAAGEPAWFLLNQQLQPVWHSLAPTTQPPPYRLGCVATDPATGQPLWAVMETDRTIHLLRADGLVDHFRVEEPIKGLSLVPHGATLNLVLVHSDRLQTYELKNHF
jgi:hypothetical protein